MESALRGIGFPEATLSIPTDSVVPDPGGAVDDDGNPILVPVTTQLVVRLRATSNGQIREQVGVDANTLALEGRCLSPVRLPPGVKPGATAALEVEGQWGVLTLLPWLESQHEAVVDALGQKFAAQWVAS